MFSIYKTKDNCCACEACRQACPHNCIEVKEDEDGYLFPVVDSTKCNDCGVCQTVCMYKCSIVKNSLISRDCFVFMNINESYRLRSSSSGAFEAICNSHGLQNTVVFGCEFSSNLVIKHNYISSESDVSRFKKSKYVQSRLGNSYSQVESFLKSGKQVIFCGTPCQIAGLKCYLKNEYDGLFTIDFVCHGVPNQKIFLKYISYLSAGENSDVATYEFRNKRLINGIWDVLGVKVRFSNGRTLELYSFEDLYMLGYLNGLYNRDCCETCKFANIERVSDITIGDFWGIEMYDRKLSYEITNGISLVLPNTERGLNICSYLDADGSLCKSVDISYALDGNEQLSIPMKKSEMRDRFLQYIRTHDFEQSIKLCFPDRFRKHQTFMKRMRGIILKIKYRLADNRR